EHGVAVVVRGAELHVVPGGQERLVHGGAGRVAVRLQELVHEGSALLDVGAGRARRGRGGDVCTDAIGFGLHCCSDALLVRLVVHGLCRHGCRNGLHVHGRCVLHVHVCSLHVCSLHVVHVHVCRLHVVHVHVCRLQGRCICRCTDEVCMHALRGACSDRRDLHTDLLAVACRLQPRGELGVALGLRDVLRDGAGGAARAGGGQRREPGAVGQALGLACLEEPVQQAVAPLGGLVGAVPTAAEQVRSEEHTSEL